MNRHELKKVLDFYSYDKADSVKLRAAYFLIENMFGHLSLAGDEMEAHQREVELLLNESDYEGVKNVISKFHFTRNNICKDIDLISSSFLIHNIEFSFNLWQNKPWCHHLSFEDFCEYILPYKYAESQVLDYWKDTLSLKFNETIDNLPENDENFRSIYYIGKSINREINEKLSITSSGVKIAQGSSFFNSTLLYRLPFGDCSDYTSLILAVLRSHGIPAIIDYIPQWGNKNTGNHRWITLLNNNGVHLPIPHLHQNPGDVFFPTNTIPKVYRQTYAINEDRNKYVKNSSYIFIPSTQFHTDVTADYTITKNIKIPIDKNKSIGNYAYIACSSFHDWNIVDYGNIADGVASFENMGCNIVYLILGYDGSELIPLSSPFILNNLGKIHYLIPKEEKRTIALTRKYPKSFNTANMENRMLGCKIQASNDKKLKEWTTLYEIRNLNYPDKILLQTDSAFRYWRFLGSETKYVNIAELYFYEMESDSQLLGKIIGAGGVYRNDSLFNYSRAFDGDWLTYYLSATSSKESWVGLDFDIPVKVKNVRCIPRSDDNSIHYDDVYELVYWKNGQWNVIERQIAKNNTLFFGNVSHNSLLLLRNVSRGVEERIFTYENNKQIWW